ncbi:MAG: HEPN domain-containing protein [Chloroflexota bacterium]|nr:HEPN domain-containing protein [Chloroflexota bacterium]
MDKATLALVRDWLVKAQRDLSSARKLATEPDPYLDTAVYHCQQAAEKAVKGLLVFYGQRFKKVHNVQFLITQALPFAPELAEQLEAAERLTPCHSLSLSRRDLGTRPARVRPGFDLCRRNLYPCAFFAT